MRIEDLNWMDVEAYLKQDDRLILVLGTIEQHGYLSLATDVKVPMALADAASQKTGVLVAPPVNYGVSPYFITYPGSFTLRISTFLDTVEDILRAAYRQGFRRILVLNGHGGNDAARSRLVEVANDLAGLKLAGTRGGLRTAWKRSPASMGWNASMPRGWKPSRLRVWPIYRKASNPRSK